MSLRLAIAIVAALATALPACTSSTLAGSYDASASQAKSGVPYLLPKVMLSVALVRDAQGVSIEISEPQYQGDSNASYLLSYRPAGSSKDTLKIAADDKTGLLKSVNGEAEDQGLEIAKALGRLAGALVKPEAAIAGARQQVLFQDVFDPAVPADVARINSGLNTALQSAMLPSNIAKPTVALAIDDYKAFAIPGQVAQPCSVGLCTRMLSPARLSVGASGLTLGARAFSMPNGSAPIPLDLRRASFVKATQTVTLSNGLVSAADRTKESEVLAIVSAPVEALKALFGAVGEIVQFKIDLSRHNKELLDAEKARLEAEQQLKDAKEAIAAANEEADSDDGSGKTEGAVEGAAGEADVMLRVVLPGLGAGSGAELVAPQGLPNTSESAVEGRRTSPQGRNRRGDASGVTGGPVVESENGTPRN
jgi:hypothetical protein